MIGGLKTSSPKVQIARQESVRAGFSTQGQFALQRERTDLHHIRSSVDVDLLAGDVVAVGNEEHNRFRDFGRLCKSA